MSYVVNYFVACMLLETRTLGDVELKLGSR